MNRLSQCTILSIAVLSLSACSWLNTKGQGAEITSANPHSNDIQTHGIAQQTAFSGQNTLSDNQNESVPAFVADTTNLPTVIQFGFNKFSLDNSAKHAIDQNISYLLKHPAAYTMLAGNTDPRGSQEYNFHLGQRRADAVKNYMLQQGVAASQLCTVSYGELKPAATPAQFSGDRHKAYAKDRRTEIIYGQHCGNQG